MFEEVKQIVLEKAKMIERRKLFSGGQPGFLGTGSSGTPAASATATTVPTAVTSPVPSASDSIEELTRQITKLTLFLEGQPQPRQQSAPRSSGPPSTNSDRPWQRKCMWCDSVEHTRRDCTEFTEALNAKVVGFNESGRIKLISTGEELPLMINRGGMKEAVRSRTVEMASRVTVVTSGDVGAISFDDQLFGKLGPQNGSARVTSLDFENGIRTDQIIDVEANEKRKRDALERTRCVPSRIDGSGPEEMQPALESNPGPSSARPTPANYGYPPPVQVSDVPEVEMTTDPTSEPNSARTSQ